MRITRLARAAGAAALSLGAVAGAADRSAPRPRRSDASKVPVASAPAETRAPAAVAPPAPASAPSVMPTMTMTPSAAPGTPPPMVPAGPPGKAEIKELVFDAGTVERGADLKHDFVIKSIGENDLTVDAKPG